MANEGFDGTAGKTEEGLRADEGFLAKLLENEVAISTPAGMTYGFLKEINPYEGYLFISPVLVQSPEDDTVIKSDEGKYISLGSFGRGHNYEVLPLPKGHLDRIVEAKKRKVKLGF